MLIAGGGGFWGDYMVFKVEGRRYHSSLKDYQVSFTVTNQNPPTRSVLFMVSAESSETGLVIPVCDFLNHVVQ